MPGLFDRYEVRGVTLRNRIVMPPMVMGACAGDGLATEWHLVHYGTRAMGGAGLILLEAAAIEPGGRARDDDRLLGMWNDQQVESLAPITRFCSAQGAATGIQLYHRGRKGERDEPPVGPSPVPFDAESRIPRELSKAGIAERVEAFAQAARRACRAGFDVVELHGAHGYLISQFLSPLANRRTDEYGGDITARARFACEVVEATRAAIPDGTPVLARISATDYVEGGNTVEEMAVASRLVHQAGADLIHVSAGGNAPDAPPAYPGYMVPLAETIRRAGGVPVIAVGLIRSPLMAEELIRNGRADLVALGREPLRQPYWPLAAARELGVDVAWPAPYESAKL
jgi:NADPH2 dehydrogenase